MQISRHLKLKLRNGNGKCVTDMRTKMNETGVYSVPAAGREGKDMVRLATKPSQRFDFALFFYVAALLVGSAIWLRLIPSGDLTGRGIQNPLWLEAGLQQTEDGRALPSVSGLELSIQQGVCNFTTADDAFGCGADNPQIAVTATIQSHAYVTRGVSLAVYSSNDFEFWRQANSVLLPRDMFHAIGRDTTDPMTVSTTACFGEPGAYYVVACAREGVPPGGSASGSARPSCQMPPCANSVGPPFSMCLAIAAACISTCDTGAVEVIPQRQYVRGQLSSRCANGTIPMSLIFANEGSDVSAAFIVFMLCYTVGVLYFMIMYLPGRSILGARTYPSHLLALLHHTLCSRVCGRDRRERCSLPLVGPLPQCCPRGRPRSCQAVVPPQIRRTSFVEVDARDGRRGLTGSRGGEA